MTEYRQQSLFDEYITDDDRYGELDYYRGYTFIQDPNYEENGKFLFKIFDFYGVLVEKFEMPFDALDLPKSEYVKSDIRKTFRKKVDEIFAKKEKERREREEARLKAMQARNISREYSDSPSSSSSSKRSSYNNYGYYSTYSGNSDYWKKKTGYVEKYCNSDTLVFHKADPSTTMLSQIYDGKGWDVITDTYIDEDEIRQLIEKHDRIIFLGHGSPAGLIGGNMTASLAPSLKGKKVFAIWCYAATFFKRNGLTGQGILCSDNAPSEVWECKAACDANVSAQWILENITYWSRCMADVCEMALEGDPEKACQIARENYYKSYADCQTDDERKVVEFNTNTIQVV